MRFYTNVEKYGSNILVRESVDGISNLRKEKYQPTIYLKDASNTNPDFLTLFKEPAKAIRPGSMAETREFCKKYEGVDGFEIFGQLDERLQYMGQYSMDGWSLDKLKCFVVDIETLAPPIVQKYTKKHKIRIRKL